MTKKRDVLWEGPLLKKKRKHLAFRVPISCFHKIVLISANLIPHKMGKITPFFFFFLGSSILSFQVLMYSKPQAKQIPTCSLSSVFYTSYFPETRTESTKDGRKIFS